VTGVVDLELWIPLTVLAAFLQNLRSALQRRAMADLSVNGATYTRFLYALPFVWAYLGWLAARQSLPAPNAEFVAYCVLGGIAQILGTASLVASFNHGNFSTGTAFSKTETVQAALFGLLLLGDTLTMSAAAGIGVSFVGVVILSSRGPLVDLVRGNRALVLGVLAGTGVGVASVSYRAAALALPSGDFLTRSGCTLALTVSLQTLMMGSWILWREPGQMARVLGSWRSSAWVGLTGAGASACWFSAMTLVSAGLVRALGQVELLFTFAAAIWVFGERVSAREVVGALLIVLGIWLLLL
jgi:drug/metabolite transporter (DMT)-like permease